MVLRSQTMNATNSSRADFLDFQRQVSWAGLLYANCVDFLKARYAPDKDTV